MEYFVVSKVLFANKFLRSHMDEYTKKKQTEITTIAIKIIILIVMIKIYERKNVNK